MSHYDDETLALLALGEAGLTSDADAHLAECPTCRAEVASLAGVVGVARRTDRADEPVAPAPQVWDRIRAELADPAPAASDEAGTDASVTELPTRSTRRPWQRLVPLAAAAVVGVIVGGGAMFALTRATAPAPTDPPAQVAAASLKPYDDPSASGTAVVRAASTTERTVTVRVTGLPATPGAFYEVWLMDPSDSRLVALGVLDAQGEGVFSVPTGLDLSTYSAIDVSLQPMNGSPLHSGDSPVRGELST